MKRAWLVAIVVIAGSARADNLWKRMADPDLQREKYDLAMRAGEDAVQSAQAQDIVDSRVATLAEKAIASYRQAAQLEPSEGEPMYRIGEIIYSLYLACYDDARATARLCRPDRAPPADRAKEALAAWDEFEKRAPLDPRNTVTGDGNGTLLAVRAVLETKLATRPHLEQAGALYEKILARGEVALASEETLGNLAEVYMMLDRLDDAIAMYRRAVRVGAQPSTAYGLAVALDRDGRGEDALAIVRDQGDPSPYFVKLREKTVFYVPEGEEYYYRALIAEAFGDIEQSIVFWEVYIKSGAHPEYQPRAREHIAALRVQLKNQPKPREPSWPQAELPW